MVQASNDKEQLVLDFFAGMGPDLEAFKENYRRYFADDIVWESVGFDRHEGIDDCLAYLDTLLAQTGMTYCDINVVNIATAGDTVLTERVDTMRRPDGSEIMGFRLMGALEVRDGKIHRYTDYLDTLGTATRLQSLAAEMGHAPVGG